MENVSDSGNVQDVYFLFHDSFTKWIGSNSVQSQDIVFSNTSLKCDTGGKYWYSCCDLGCEQNL